ncbi:MAG: amidohydrolase family protein [Candidatus Cloacimonadaceae bacterium]
MKLIRNVLMASGKSFKTVNLLFDDKIRQVSTGAVDFADITEEYDYSGCIVMPGAVDMHTHIMDGSDDDNSRLQSFSKLALDGGFTTLGDLSYKAQKPIFKQSDIKYFEKLINNNSHCDMALWGHCDFSKFPYHLDYMNEVWSGGVVGFVIMHPSPTKKIENMAYKDIMDLFDTIYDTDISFAYQGYDDSEPSQHKELKSIFIEQRLNSIRKILRRLQDNPVHYVGIFDKDTIEVLNIAFRRADITYAYPVRELMDLIEKFNVNGYKKDEPLSEFVKLLFDSMKNGKLYTISTESGFSDIADTVHDLAYAGYSEKLLKWTVPWAFSELWNKNKVSIQSCIRMLSENPAKRMGLFPVKGAIIKGSDADITIIDPETSVKTDLLDSQGRKVTLSCSVKATFLRGDLHQGAKSKTGLQGKFVRRTGTTRRKSSSTCWT